MAFLWWGRKSQKKPPPERDPDSFGNIAKARGYISQEALDEARRRQMEPRLLGDILVKMESMTEAQKTEVLLEQKRRAARKTKELVKIELDRQEIMALMLDNDLKQVTNLSQQAVATLKK